MTSLYGRDSESNLVLIAKRTKKMSTDMPSCLLRMFTCVLSALKLHADGNKTRENFSHRPDYYGNSSKLRFFLL